MDDLLADFVAETREMLEASEGEIIAWEADPADRSRLDAIFRFVHTVKGNCGFFDFPRLASLSHAAEDVLSDVRADRRQADPALVTAVLAVIDRITQMVDAIEAGEDFPEGGDEELIAALGSRDDDDFAQHDLSTVEEAEAAPETSDTNSAGEEAPASRIDQASNVQRSIRLPVDLLDRVMSGVSDMVLARNDLAHRLRQAGNQPTIDGPFERLTAILTDVRDAITRMRMQRIETLFNALPRLVRDLSADLDKQVMIDLEGGDVELDREMIEMVRDPLTHIIRNAIDHGIEKPHDRLKQGKREIGMLSIAARQSGNKISLVITDDGRGLDADKIGAKAVANGLVTESELRAMSREEVLNLVFIPGLSTAETISAISGRGVGLDVVRENIEKIGGSIKVNSKPGEGTLFYVQIPLTLSIIAGLTVEVGSQRFAIPQSYVEEIIHVGTESVDYTHVGETALVTFRGIRTPCLSLADVLGLKHEVSEDDLTMVMLRLASGDLFALAIDGIHSHGDLVVKPLPPAIMETNLYGGTTLLDDGQPILVLDMPLIAFENGIVSEARSNARRRGETETTTTRQEHDQAMLFADYAGNRSAVRLELVRRIETIDPSSIDISTGGARAVIDGVILPLVGLPESELPSERLRLLRLADGACELLYAVRSVEDAVALDGTLKPVDDDPLVEAVTLIDGQTVSLIDGHELFARHGEAPEPGAKPVCRLPEGDWASTILAPLVRAAGYETTTDPESESDIAIMLDDESSAHAESVSDVIRLRSQVDASANDGSIYRYDRDGLVDALRRARAGGIK